MRSIEPSRRAVLGFVAGVIAVLIFHQGAWATLHLAGLMPPPYPMGPTPPWGVPETLNFCFWGGLWGAAYGLVAPKLALPPWLSGLMLGVIANLVLLPLFTIVDGYRRGLRRPWLYFVSSLFTSFAFAFAFYFATIERQRRRAQSLRAPAPKVDA